MNHLIRKIVISTGVVTTLAGSGSAGLMSGTGTSARFNYPALLATNGFYLYVADSYNHAIRQIVISTGYVATIAGGTMGLYNGRGSTARFNKPFGITTDGTNVYVAERENHLIRKIE